MHLKNFIKVRICLFTLLLFISINLGAQSNLYPSKNYLLLIGIDEYENWNSLNNPEKDAKEFRDVMVNNYQVDQVIQCFGKNARKQNIIFQFNQLSKQISATDSLLVYFAGHGYFDSQTNTGYLIPTEGGKDPKSKSFWISQDELRGLIKKIIARNILLILDSCFSGSIIEDSKELMPDQDPRIRKTLKSRLVLTAGGNEKVPDNSQFYKTISQVLIDNQRQELEIHNLFQKMKIKWPQGNFKMGFLSGLDSHQDGSTFIFVPQNRDDKGPGVLVVRSEHEFVAKLDGVVEKSDELRKDHEAVFPNVEQGEYEIEVEFVNGFKYRSRQFVLEGVRNYYVPYFEITESDAKSLIISPSLGISLPIEHFYHAYFPGPAFGLLVGWQPFAGNLTFQLAIESGLKIYFSKPENIIPGLLFSIPFHANLKFCVSLSELLMVYFQAAGGLSRNIFINDEYSIPGYTCPSFQPGLGLTARISKHFNLSVNIHMDIYLSSELLLAGGLNIKSNFLF